MMYPVPASLPPNHPYAVRQSSGIQEASDHTRLLGDWKLSYEQLSRGRFSGSLTEIWVEDIHIYRETLGQSVFQSGAARPGRINMGVFEALSGEARWFGQSIDADDIMFLNNGSELLLSTPKESTLLVLSIPGQGLLAPDSQAAAPSHIHNRDLAQSIRVQLHHALSQLLSQPLRFARQGARQQFQLDMKELVADCLQTTPPTASDPGRGRAASVVRSAIEHVMSQPEETPSIDELCQVTLTCRRNLQKCFERMTGESPAQFLKAQRLNAVRREILQAPGARLIGDIAADWGFWHISQFSTDYRKLFGESPSDTVHYARWSRR